MTSWPGNFQWSPAGHMAAQCSACSSAFASSVGSKFEHDGTWASCNTAERAS